MRVFAGACGSRNAGRAEDAFMGGGDVGGKIRPLGSMLFSLSSNLEWKGRLDVSLGPADVCGLRGGFVRSRPTGGGEGSVGFGVASAEAPD